MSNITKTEDKSLIIPKEKYEMAKSLVAKGATDAEFELLLHIANKYKLDPLLKEIWCIKRNPRESALIMTSRDGYLAIAHRSGQFDGMQSGTLEDTNGKLVKAWCEVWRKDMSHSFKSEVRYTEYVQNSFIWQKYPSAMLIKVAEVFALKRAFSISGMLTQEEVGYQEVDGMATFDPTDLSTASQNTDPSLQPQENTLDQDKSKIIQLGEKLGLDAKTTKETVETKYKLAAFDEITDDQAKDTIKVLEKKLHKSQM
jgi:phage recombination protein Bet